MLSEKLILPKDAIVIRSTECGDAMLLTDKNYFIYQFRIAKELHLVAFKGEDHLKDRLLLCLDHINAIERCAFEPESILELPSLSGLKR